MSKLKNKSLAAEIGELITAKTKFDSDDEAEETSAKVVDFDDDEGDGLGDAGLQDSSLRKRNIQLLDKVDKRYAGKKVSRKDIFKADFDSDHQHSSDSESKSDSELDEIDSDDYAEGSDDSESANISKEMNSSEIEDEDDAECEDEEECDDEEESEDDDEDDDYDDDGDMLKDMDGTQSSDDKIIKMSTVNEEEQVEKGKHVQNQIKLYENLLELRIKFQKCLTTSNMLPQFDVYPKLSSDPEFKKESKAVQNNITSLLDKLLELNSILSSKSIVTKNKIKPDQENANNSADDMDEEIPSDTENELSENEDEVEEKAEDQVPKKKRKLKLADYEKQMSTDHKSYIPCRNAEIQKWNDKTRIATAVLNKGSNQPIVQQIEYILKDRSKLVKRTQLKRSNYKIVGKQSVEEGEDGRRVEEYDKEIYDDDDFYHELLREFIHQKTSNITDPTQLGKQWVQLQSMRSKLKRKIDTRATKGRRLRYNVHQKLVNYMAPILVNDTMLDRAKDELYGSLFGKMKPANNETGTA